MDNLKKMLSTLQGVLGDLEKIQNQALVQLKKEGGNEQVFSLIEQMKEAGEKGDISQIMKIHQEANNHVNQNSSNRT